jgi:hypothetical protein
MFQVIRSMRSLQYLFRIPACTIGIIVKEVFRALWDVPNNEYLKVICTQKCSSFMTVHFH